MFKERVKSAVIVALIVNALFLASQLWLGNLVWQDAQSVFSSWTANPIFRLFTPKKQTPSVPKENLSRPRRLVINDGSLWVAYYNTDDSFDALSTRARFFVGALLRGSAKKEGAVEYKKWLEYLSDKSLYVEYPIAVAPTLLARAMGINAAADSDLKSLREVIILPSDASHGVRLLARDESRILMYSFDSAVYSFPEEEMVAYAKNNPSDGYFEFAFSTLLNLSDETDAKVRLDDMVLFSDTQPSASALYAANIVTDATYPQLLKAFSFNAQPLRHYTDTDGSVNYVENYATIKIYPDSLLEYSAISPDKGIRLCDASAPLYETVNAAIDFAENVWNSCATGAALNVLVSSSLTDFSDTDSLKITFDYYYDGRPVSVDISSENREPLKNGIELEIADGRLVSYRQLLRRYVTAPSSSKGESFVSALDYFVSALSMNEESVVISDLFWGYVDKGDSARLGALWIARLSDGRIFERKAGQEEVPQ